MSNKKRIFYHIFIVIALVSLFTFVFSLISNKANAHEQSLSENFDIVATNNDNSLNGSELWWKIDNIKCLHIAPEKIDENYKEDSWVLNGCDSTSKAAPWKTLEIKMVEFDKGKNDLRLLPNSTAYWFYDIQTLTSIVPNENMDTSNTTSMSHMFANCTDLLSLNLFSFDTKKVTDLSYMFSNCTSLTKLYVSNFNTENVKDMSYMFNKCQSLRILDLDIWSSKNLQSVDFMFDECSKLTEIHTKTFDISKKFTSVNVFSGCINLIGGKDTKYSEQPEMDRNFGKYGCIDKGPKSDSPGYFTYRPELWWKVDNDVLHIAPYQADENYKEDDWVLSECSDINPPPWKDLHVTSVLIEKGESDLRLYPYSTTAWFLGLKDLTSIEGFDNLCTSKVQDMSRMFKHCESLTSLDLRSFDTKKVIFMEEMFSECNNLKDLNLSSFNTQNVNRMFDMFSWCSHLTDLNLSNFNTENVDQMDHMFDMCDSLENINLSSFCTKSVKSMNYMFSNCSSLLSLDLRSFNLENVKSTNSMFFKCSSLKNLDLSNFNCNNVYSMNCMFKECTSLQTLNLKNFHAENVHYMEETFSGCESLLSLDLSSLYIENVEYMPYLFYSCTSLKTINMGKFNAKNATNMSFMFSMCSSLINLDVSNFNTENAEDIGGMFDGCSSLLNLDLSSFKTENVIRMDAMFSECKSLKKLNLKNFTCGERLEKVDYMFNDCKNLVTVYTNTFDLSSNQKYSKVQMFRDCPALVGAAGTKFLEMPEADRELGKYACIDKGSSKPGYFTPVVYDDFTKYVEEKLVYVNNLLKAGDTVETIDTINKAVLEINNYKYQPDKTFEENKAAIDSIVSKVEVDIESQRKSNFENFKTQEKQKILNMKKDGDSANAESIIQNAYKKIDTIVYDNDKSPLDNQNIVTILEQETQDLVNNDRLDNFKAYKDSAISILERLKDTFDTEEVTSIISDGIEKIKSMAYDSKTTPNKNKSFIDDIVNIIEDQLKDIRIPEYNSYKADKITEIEGLIKEDDSDAVKTLIHNVKSKIEELQYDKTLNLSDNKKFIQTMVDQVKTDIEKQRKEDDKQKQINQNTNLENGSSAKTVDMTYIYVALMIIFALGAFITLRRCVINKNL